VVSFFNTWVGSYENHCFEIKAHTFIFQIRYSTNGDRRQHATSAPEEFTLLADRRRIARHRLDRPRFEFRHNFRTFHVHVYTVLVDKGLFLKNQPTLANKRFIRPSSRLKSVHLDYRSSLSISQLLRFWFKSSQSLTTHERQFLPGILSLKS